MATLNAVVPQHDIEQGASMGHVTPRTAAALLACASLVTAPLPAVADPPLVQLELLQPIAKPGRTPVEYTPGFPLVLRASWSSDVPLYDLVLETEYDKPLAQTFAVFADPAGCLASFLSYFPSVDDPPLDRATTCLAQPPGEVYMEFSQDRELPGEVDTVGNGQMLRAGIGNSPTQASDDWPGLVLLSNRGRGLVLDPGFTRPAVHAQYNLAGLLEWTGFELADAQRRSSVTAGALLDFAWVGPAIVADGSVDPFDPVTGEYSGLAIYRVDGGPVQTGLAGETSVGAVYTRLVAGMEFELRAFVVNGTAPNKLLDRDGDRDIDATDAALAGYRVISNEQVLRYRISPALALRVYQGLYEPFDFDGNGAAASSDDDVLIGPGQIVKPPR